MRSLKNFFQNDQGGVLAEYGILIAVLVLGLVAVITAFRTQLSTWFGTIGTNLQSAT